MRSTRIYRGDVPDLILPEHLAAWDVHDYWEREVYDSMAALREEGEVLWVIGAEHGYMAALWARLFGGQTVLIEPSPPFWRNIRLTWEANGLPTPNATIQAFLSDTPAGSVTVCESGWPDSAAGDEECPAQEYRYLWQESHAQAIAATTVDALVQVGVPAPTALTCDTEGAEVRILPGAQATLAEHDVKCWLSLHPDLIERDYPGHSDQEVHDLMGELGYDGDLLSTDHEQHWLYVP